MSKQIEKVKWRWDWDIYVPFCPYCDEVAYYKDHCVFCGNLFEWVEGEVSPSEVTEGEYTVCQSTGGGIYVYKNGELVMHSQCTVKKTEEELKDFIPFYEEMEGAERGLPT